MIDLLKSADPATGIDPDQRRLRSLVDERVGFDGHSRPASARHRRPLLIGAAAFAAVVAAVALPMLLRQDTGSVYAPRLDGIRSLPGVESVTPIGTGGVKTMAVDGDTIWVMAALQNQLYRISATTGNTEETYDIDAYVEGVEVGGGYVWLLSYDAGGELLRFDPTAGVVDRRLPIGGLPGGMAWFGDFLWVGNDQGELHRVSADGEIASTEAGELKGEGLGYLWVNDPETGLISSLAEDGSRGAIVVPTDGTSGTAEGWGVREVTESGGFLWLMDGDYPWGTGLGRFDPATGELDALPVTFGLHSMASFDGALWVTSHTDHVVYRVDPASGELQRYPLPGKSGGLAVADGSLWVTLFHPGALLRLDTGALTKSGPVVFDSWDDFPHRLLCTGSAAPGRPTVILEPVDWIDYGSWSVVQAMLSAEGFLVCADGYVEGEATAAERAAALEQALGSEGIEGPFLLVAAGDGVHASRIFADNGHDIAGVVFVDPIPVGFPDFLDETLGQRSGTGHPPWLDLDPAVSDSLGDLGDVPLTVIGQDPEATYLSPQAIEGFGEEAATALNGSWQDGLDFYAGLSTDSRSVGAPGTGFDMLIWDRPDLVVDEVVALLER